MKSHFPLLTVLVPMLTCFSWMNRSAIEEFNECISAGEPNRSGFYTTVWVFSVILNLHLGEHVWEALMAIAHWSDNLSSNSLQTISIELQAPTAKCKTYQQTNKQCEYVFSGDHLWQEQSLGLGQVGLPVHIMMNESLFTNTERIIQAFKTKWRDVYMYVWL